MANFNKKWGTVIACWAVALVMIITGVCLGLTIPSSAADEEYEGDIAVMFDANGDGVIGEDETTVYHTLSSAFYTVDNFETTAGNPVKIKLLSNVTGGGVMHTPDDAKNFIFDLNGYVVSVYNFMVGNEGGTFQIIDSRPDAIHYVALVGKNREYDFVDEAGVLGYDSIVRGGIIMSKSGSCFFNLSVNNADAELIIDGGTFLGRGYVTSSKEYEAGNAKVVINQGVNWQWSFDAKELGNMEEITGQVAFITNSEMEINGGNIYGQVVEFKEENGENVCKAVDLTDVPHGSSIKIKEGIKMVETEVNGVKVYTAVDATTGEPIVPEEPDVPTVTEQPTNNNNSLIALIVLGAAAAVMVVGVTVIIIVNAKRRKKVA